MHLFMVLTTQWTPALVAAYHRAIITVAPLLCETYNRAEDHCVLALGTFSRRNLCAHPDECQAALHLRVWNRMTESESEWRTPYKSFKNYSWIMAQLTFSFSPNQGISCSYSPFFFLFFGDKMSDCLCLLSFLFPSPWEQNEECLTLHTKKRISTKGTK